MNTPLNPDALMERIAGIIDSECQSYDAAVRGSDEILYGETTDLPSCAAEKIMALIRPHLAVAQPVVNSVEELDALPPHTVIEEHEQGHGVLIKRGTRSWECLTHYVSGLPSGDLDLPARVLYLPPN